MVLAMLVKGMVLTHMIVLEVVLVHLIVMEVVDDRGWAGVWEHFLQTKWKGKDSLGPKTLAKFNAASEPGK